MILEALVFVIGLTLMALVILFFMQNVFGVDRANVAEIRQRASFGDVVNGTVGHIDSQLETVRDVSSDKKTSRLLANGAISKDALRSASK